MAEKKNKQKKNPIEDLLWDGEKILWMGKPNTSWSEYARLKPYPIDATVDGEIVYRDENEAMSCGGMWIFVSMLLSMGLFALLGNVYDSYLLPRLGNNIFISLMMIPIGFGILLASTFILSLLFITLQKYIFSLREPHHVWYAVTNKRLYISLPWETFYIMHFDLTKAIVEDGQFGSIITWSHKALGRSQNEFPPFIGLNDFDVLEVLRLVNKHYLVIDLPIDDRREKKKV